MSRILYSGNYEWPGGPDGRLAVFEEENQIVRMEISEEAARYAVVIPEDIFREMILTCMGQTVGLYSGNRVPFIASTDQAKAVVRDNLEFLKRYVADPSERKKGNVLRVAAALALCYMADEGILRQDPSS